MREWLWCIEEIDDFYATGSISRAVASFFVPAWLIGFSLFIWMSCTLVILGVLLLLDLLLCLWLRSSEIGKRFDFIVASSALSCTLTFWFIILST